MKLHGKVAVVTGGLRGIGHAIALAMAQEGADLLIAGLSMDRAAQTEQEIEALGRRCVVVRADVADAAAVKAMIACTVQHFGGLDILVNNAGIALFKPIDEFTAAEFARVVDVNLKGPWLCAKYAFPELKRVAVSLSTSRPRRATMAAPALGAAPTTRAKAGCGS